MERIDYLRDQEKFIRAFKMKSKRNKIRTIITYANNEYGRWLRQQHKIILKKLEKIPYSNMSYAYKKSTCTKDALENHYGNTLFIKLDIHNFFESITEEHFHDVCDSLLETYKINEDLSCCFYRNHLILGFVTSPKISDIYLHKFDCFIEEYLKKHKSLSYSRYCDDILISSNDIDFGELHQFQSRIEEQLNKFNLEINRTKVKEYDLDKDPSVSFLGLNLSYENKKKNKPKITLSKKYIIKALKYLEEYKAQKETINALVIEKNKMLTEHQECIKNNIDDVEFKQRIRDIHYKIIENERKANFIFNDANSIIYYIEYNSKITYKKFMEKHKNKFGFNWREKNWR